MMTLPGSTNCNRAGPQQLPIKFSFDTDVAEENIKSMNNGSSRGRKTTAIHISNDDLMSSIYSEDNFPSRSGYLSNRYDHPLIENRNERRQKITINVSGERYQTFVDTLDRFPTTLLGNRIKREEFYDDVEDEYFFDRDRSAFNAILYYYQSNGQLYCPLTVPMTILVTEAKFFQLGNDALKQVLDLTNENKKRKLPKNKFQKKIWCLFEYPETSRAAHFLTLFSMMMILLSVSLLCIETLQVFKDSHFRKSSKKSPKVTNYNNTQTEIRGPPVQVVSLAVEMINKNITHNVESSTLSKNITLDVFNSVCMCKCQCVANETYNIKNFTAMKLTNNDGSINWLNIFDTCEAIFVAWFTIEFIIRFISAPSKCSFIKNYLNIIDVISILPFYLTIAFNKYSGLGLENFRVIRLIRVFRIFKLSRHSKGLQILGMTLQASVGELGLMIFFLAIGVVLFSSAVFYLEDGNFTSIPDAFWWALITMCTVGYGDKVPKSFFGKVIGGACAICGVLSIALPVPVIVSNFDYFYNRERTKKLHESYISENEETREETESPVNHSEASAEYTENQRNTSPLICRQTNGSIKSMKSPVEIRNDEIQRQATIRGLEKRSRKLSQRLSQTSMLSPSRRPLSGVAEVPG